MGDILNISKRKAIDKIDSLGKELFTQHGIPFHRTKRMDCMTAMTEKSHIGTAINVVVGTKEINHTYFYQNVSDEVFVRTILNIATRKMWHFDRNHWMSVRKSS